MKFNEKLAFEPLKDSSMRGRVDSQSFICVTVDIGNGTMTAITPDGILSMPHAVHLLEPDELRQLESAGGNDPNLYFTNGRPYLFGDTVSADETSKFAVRLGTQRYEHEYIGGILGAMLFNSLGKSYDMIHLMVNHPPSHSHYREEIIAATQAKYFVEHGGKTKEFTVYETACYDEPRAGFMWTLLNPDDPERAELVKRGRWLIVDIGAFTTDLTLVIDGKPQVSYKNNRSIRFGMIDVLDDFERTMRVKERGFFRNVQVSPRDVIRDAFAYGEYNGGGYGNLPVHQYASAAGKKGVKQILKAIDGAYGGIGQIDGIVLSGGGGSEKALGEFFNDARMNQDEPTKRVYFGTLPIVPAQENQDEMHLVTVKGAKQLQTLMKARGVLWRSLEK